MIYVLVGTLCFSFSPSLNEYNIFVKKKLLAVCHPPSPLYISRAAALAANIPYTVPISTINRLCSSGLMSIRAIAHAIQAGETSIGWAVGAESMSLKYVNTTPIQLSITNPSPPVLDLLRKSQRQSVRTRMLTTPYK